VISKVVSSDLSVTIVKPDFGLHVRLEKVVGLRTCECMVMMFPVQLWLGNPSHALVSMQCLIQEIEVLKIARTSLLPHSMANALGRVKAAWHARYPRFIRRGTAAGSDDSA